jgi:branched-chain amino acid transport system substrate-binding protein
LKKLVFLIIGALLLVGLVLPGCTGPATPENVIKIAVCGPFTDLQGQNHWDGANMAVDEINDAGGVTINGTAYTVELVKVETKEATEGESGTTGTANLENVIDDVAFCVGGFRTEVVSVYREVAMTAKKLFMNCGAATDSLQFSVVQDYDTYKYWFKATPYNSTFLVKSCLKMTAVVGAVLAGNLLGYDALVDPDYKITTAVGGKLRVAILMENAAWCLPMVPAAEYYLPVLGFNTTATGLPDDWVWLVSPTDNDITDVLTAIEAEVHPHIIFTAFSGSVGAVYSKNKATLGLPAMTIGINVPGQQLSHWVNTGGSCVGEVMLDTWAVNMSTNTGTVDWFNDYVATTGRYPVYTAGTYDAIKNVCTAIEDLGSTDSDALVAWLEDPDNAMLDSVASPKVMYYPMPDITINSSAYALSEDQVLALYPDIGDPWIRTTPYGSEAVMDGYHTSDWMCGASSMPHIAHDLVYGPGYVTGIGSQWQEISGSGVKVGVWPTYVGVTSPTFKLTDQYGNWNFQYDGTASLYIPIAGFLA